jgi:hypothetical protein
VDQVDVAFDDERVVVAAGLLLQATLARRLGIEKLTGQLMDLGERPARRVPGCKLLSLVHAIVASDGPSLSLAERGRQGVTRHAEW